MVKKMHTPWGEPQGCTEFGDGIHFYDTASHGGFFVSDEMMRKMPEAFRNLGGVATSDGSEGFYNGRGFYEEDCEASMVLFSFPELFPDTNRERCIRALLTYYPKRAQSAGIEL